MRRFRKSDIVSGACHLGSWDFYGKPEEVMPFNRYVFSVTNHNEKVRRAHHSGQENEPIQQVQSRYKGQPERTVEDMKDGQLSLIWTKHRTQKSKTLETQTKVPWLSKIGHIIWFLLAIFFRNLCQFRHEWLCWLHYQSIKEIIFDGIHVDR